IRCSETCVDRPIDQRYTDIEAEPSCAIPNALPARSPAAIPCAHHLFLAWWLRDAKCWRAERTCEKTIGPRLSPPQVQSANRISSTGTQFYLGTATQKASLRSSENRTKSRPDMICARGRRARAIP